MHGGAPAGRWTVRWAHGAGIEGADGADAGHLGTVPPPLGRGGPLRHRGRPTRGVRPRPPARDHRGDPDELPSSAGRIRGGMGPAGQDRLRWVRPRGHDPGQYPADPDGVLHDDRGVRTSGPGNGAGIPRAVARQPLGRPAGTALQPVLRG
ncbi:hypothetical protein ACFFX0_19585 [Citricoccus parietis]|uniref:Uncharacterized protein n=1 Tax=Citricoccus parietis TaxID=592307 RepID=A0ABV5G3P9_9MICC